MKLVHIGLETQIKFDKDYVNEWIIESPTFFTKYIKEMLNQINGIEGEFVLSDEEKTANISKYVEVIINPFVVDVNDKKILSKIYDQLISIAVDEKNYMRTQEVTNELLSYLIDITNDSDYIMYVDAGLDMALLFKAAGVKMEQDDSDFLSNLIKYIELICNFFKRKLIILVNFRSYVCDSKYEEFINMCRYKKLNILLMESIKKDCVSGVKQYIMDRDQCEIF